MDELALNMLRNFAKRYNGDHSTDLPIKIGSLMVSLLAMLLSLLLTMLLIEFMIRVNGPEDGVTLSGFSWDECSQGREILERS